MSIFEKLNKDIDFKGLFKSKNEKIDDDMKNISDITYEEKLQEIIKQDNHKFSFDKPEQDNHNFSFDKPDYDEDIQDEDIEIEENQKDKRSTAIIIIAILIAIAILISVTFSIVKLKQSLKEVDTPINISEDIKENLIEENHEEEERNRQLEEEKIKRGKEEKDSRETEYIQDMIDNSTNEYNTNIDFMRGAGVKTKSQLDAESKENESNKNQLDSDNKDNGQTKDDKGNKTTNIDSVDKGIISNAKEENDNPKVDIKDNNSNNSKLEENN